MALEKGGERDAGKHMAEGLRFSLYTFWFSVSGVVFWNGEM